MLAVGFGVEVREAEREVGVEWLGWIIVQAGGGAWFR